MDNVQIFTNVLFRVRTILDDDDTIWVVAKDVAEALDYNLDGGMSRIFGHVPDCWTGGKRIAVRSENGVEQEREMLCLTEQGLYFFLGRSDKKKALPYQMWIAGEVVPAIRKHGMYATPAKVEEILGNPDIMIGILQAFKDEKTKRQELQAKVELDRPKVLFADAVDASKESILVGNLAKLLKQNGVNIGQTRLFAWLRDNGYLMNCRGERWNMPTQKSMDKGLFEVKKSVVNSPDGVTKVTHTPKVTGKGQVFFVNLFLQNLKGGE